MKTIRQKQGFTIIEVIVVLAIAGLILSIVFLAVPAVQRNSRNRARERDAALIVTAINECMVNANRYYAACNTPEEIGITADQLGIYTGIHYGSSGTNPDGTEIPNGPSPDEPNWLFNLKCNTALTNFMPRSTETTDTAVFVVTYLKENSSGGLFSRCLDGQS